ncbi:MAG: hypothetical protein K8S14_06715, partial [Actinomycetia bacterium]|nr:hypothetical protein [Actinomycetes bacterium]
LLRIAMIWLAFYGAGCLFMRIALMRKYFRSMPSVIPGMLLYMGVAVLLSLLHLLTRSIVPIFIILGAAAGLVVLYLRLKNLFADFKFRVKHPVIILPILLTGYILISNLMLAGRPEINFNDTQVTYLVQPDRWLNDGKMSFIDETGFSAYPMTSEMLLLLPSSLAEDRLDQMILGQVFELSMIIAMILISMILLKFGWKWFPAASISIAGCSTILLWCHFAKPDSTALLFVTVSMVILLKQISDSEKCTDYSAFLVMGLALTSKFTVYITLILFIILSYLYLRKYTGVRTILFASIILILLPLIFAIRTVIHTGTPFYPHAPFRFLINPEWRMPDIHLTYSVFNDRSSDFFPNVGFFQNIWHYFGTWNSSIFLLLAGFLLTLRSKYMKRRVVIITGFAIYSVICMYLFYPSWWGAKYGILLIPFATFFGLHLLRKFRYGLLLATTISVVFYFIYDTSLSPTEHYGLNFRNELICSYVTNNWEPDSISILEKQLELRATLWMNSHIPDNSNILSFYITKRYFSNHRWIIAWRYPLAMHLYLENPLTTEISILEDLRIDYVFIEYDNPATFDDENSVELFSRIGRGDLLDPVINIDGYTVCKFCPENL